MRMPNLINLVKIPGQIALLGAGLIIAQGSFAQVSFEQILNSEDTPENWLTYNGGFKNPPYSRPGRFITRNPRNLKRQCAFA